MIKKGYLRDLFNWTNRGLSLHLFVSLTKESIKYKKCCGCVQSRFEPRAVIWNVQMDPLDSGDPFRQDFLIVNIMHNLNLMFSLSGHVEMRQLPSIPVSADPSMPVGPYGVQELLRAEVSVRKVPSGKQAKYSETSGQSYKLFMLMNYDSRVVIWVFSSQV